MKQSIHIDISKLFIENIFSKIKVQAHPENSTMNRNPHTYHMHTWAYNSHNRPQPT